MTRIICLGNRYAASDCAGPRVFEILRQRALPPQVEALDGGLAGLDLLQWLEGARQVIFVDALSEDLEAGDSCVRIMTGPEVAALAGDHYEHAAGLPYLLRILPGVLKSPPPQILLVGIKGPADDFSIRLAAEVAVRLAGAEHPAGPPPGKHLTRTSGG